MALRTLFACPLGLFNYYLYFFSTISLHRVSNLSNTRKSKIQFPSQKKKMLENNIKGKICRRAVVSIDSNKADEIINFYEQHIVPAYEKEGLLG